jgi:hypothetical protein
MFCLTNRPGRHAVFVSILGLAFLSSRPVQAQDVSAIVTNSVIQVFTEAIVNSLDTKSTVVYFVDDAMKVVQLHCQTEKVGMFGVDVGPCRDAPAGADVDLLQGGGSVPPIPTSAKRSYRVILKDVALAGSPKGDLELTATAGGGPVLLVSTDKSQFANRDQLILAPDRVANPAVALEAIRKARDKIRITYTFAKDDPEPPLIVRAAAVELTPAKTALEVKPSVALPRRPKKYSVKVEIPIADSGVPSTEFPADAQVMAGATAVELLPAAVERATSAFYFEAAFTSSVASATSGRTNVGVFAFHLKPTFAVLSNVDGSTDGSSSWWAVRPLLDADVDTRPAAQSKVPNRIVFGIDHDWGWDAGLAAGDGGTGGRSERFLQQTVVTNGAHYESDRDFKLQTAFWHLEFRPVFKDWEQARERRQFLFSQWLAMQDPKTTTRKQPRVSSYYVRPSVAYDIGGVVRDRNGIHPYDNDTINRMPWRLDAGIEFLRTLVFAATHDYHVVWNVDSDKGRSYVEARVELNTGTLFRLDRNSLQHAVTFKYQRGEQAPTFKPVDTFSVGVRFFR